MPAFGDQVFQVINGQYETVAASQTAQVLGATGAVGDLIDGLIVIPTTVDPGVVTLLDGATSINVFAGGVASLSNLVPFFIPLGLASVSGAWKVTTGAGVFANNASATVGTAYAETKTLWTTSAASYPLLSFGVATLYPLYSATEVSTAIRTSDGTNNVAKTGISDMNTAMRKVASSWTGAQLRVTGTNQNAASGTFDGNMGSTAIGIGNPTTGSGVTWNGNIRNVKFWAGSAANPAQLKSLTL